MTNDELKFIVSGWVAGVEFPENKQYLEVLVPAESLHKLAKLLKDTRVTNKKAIENRINRRIDIINDELNEEIDTSKLDTSQQSNHDIELNIVEGKNIMF